MDDNVYIYPKKRTYVFTQKLFLAFGEHKVLLSVVYKLVYYVVYLKDVSFC